MSQFLKTSPKLLIYFIPHDIHNILGITISTMLPLVLLIKTMKGAFLLFLLSLAYVTTRHTFKLNCFTSYLVPGIFLNFIVFYNYVRYLYSSKLKFTKHSPRHPLHPTFSPSPVGQKKKKTSKKNYNILPVLDK